MCGIAGGTDLSLEHLDQGIKALRHRGPDGTGTFSTQNFNVGMTRLAILDLANGAQPFASPNKRVQVVCNGEIYNWKELRTQLRRSGHRFHTECDCEILPAAWIEWGEKMFSKLVGMFAIALHDQRTRTLYLGRDRCGEKPLYYSTQGPFRFASEVKALAKMGVPLRPEAAYLSTWLSLRYLPEPKTLFQNIETVPAAHYLKIPASEKPTLTRYWEPSHRDPMAFDKDIKTSVAELDKLTRSAVERALQADVPVATYLSAGVDSSLLAHYVKDLGADVTTVSIGFGAGSDETTEAARFAKSLALPHHSRNLTPDCLEDLPRVIAQMERPVGDALIMAFDRLASHTSSLGCKVALGGEGPDEHFAGYSFQKAYQRAKQLGAIGRQSAAAALQLAPGKLLDLTSQFPASLGGSGRKKVVSYLKNFSKTSEFERITGLHTLFESTEISEFLHPSLREEQQDATPTLAARRGSPLDTPLRSQYQSWLPDWSLIRQDKNAMAHSLEYRAPFLDHRIIDFAFEQPDSYKISGRQDKFLWRELAAKHLPKEVTQRVKQPFYLPLEQDDWRTKLITLAREILSRENLAHHNWLSYDAVAPLFSAREFLPLKKLASLLILQLWLDQHAS